MKEDLNEWLKGFENGRPDADENERLTKMLKSPAHLQVRSVVQSLPDDMPSLQWRSALNEKLLALAPIKKKISAWAIGLRALGAVGFACLVVLAFSLRHRSGPAAQKPSIDFASVFVSEHRQSVASAEIAGPGAVDSEPERSNENDSNSGNDTDVDSI